MKLSAYQVDLLNESVELIRTASQETGDCSMHPLVLVLAGACRRSCCEFI